MPGKTWWDKGPKSLPACLKNREKKKKKKGGTGQSKKKKE